MGAIVLQDRLVEAAVLHGLGDVVLGDVFQILQVGEGAGDAENLVVGAGAEAERVQRGFEEGFAGFVQHAVFAQGLGVEVGVVAITLAVGTGMLAFAGSQDLIAYFLGGGATAFRVGQLVKAQGGDVHMDVDAVEQRPGESAHVALHIAGAATALAAGIGAAAAGALLRCLFARSG